jgi:acetyl esterase/lipase
MAVQLAGDAVAARVPHVRLVVQLAGLVDLVGTHRRDIGNGAVVTALGGTPEERPQAYAQASPLERLPVGVPQAVVVGTAESPDLREMSRRYVRAARAAGDDVALVEADGDHFTVIDPASAIWQRTADLLARSLG